MSYRLMCIQTKWQYAHGCSWRIDLIGRLSNREWETSFGTTNNPLAVAEPIGLCAFSSVRLVVDWLCVNRIDIDHHRKSSIRHVRKASRDEGYIFKNVIRCTSYCRASHESARVINLFIMLKLKRPRRLGHVSKMLDDDNMTRKSLQRYRDLRENNDE